ncbi:site-specific integrase [Muricoccus pecuniae]|uniref:Tyr recombinase domain-containing protein n=1 Tax=Muricoccus pecuniae TaxID=693023 RepID=A0A840YIX9_9PROT|nr:tyrosine-type recombinase/integrase [Roseomonas pecuniae]MBB5696511.1 hypothetical protein [Roseomonas pecuniae]
MSAPDPRRRCLKLEEWPASHRAAWEVAMARKGRRFSTRGSAAHLADKSIEKTGDGYGRWLGFLSWHGLLREEVGPAELVTPELADRYFDELIALGNADYTVVGRFDELAGAMRILVPSGDFRWLQSPGGVSLRNQLDMRKRQFTVHHAAEIRDWGIGMMREALEERGPRRRQVMLRDGLLIAIFATRGMRLRSMAALRLGHQVAQDSAGTWSIALDEEDVKTGRPIAYPLSPSLQSWMTRYVEVERRELLAGKESDAFWVNWGGEALGIRGIDKRIRWRSEKHYGSGAVFGPHRLRHDVGTTGSAMDPEGLGGAVEMLGISAPVYHKHYNRGKGLEAAARFHDALRKAREKE